MLEVGIANKVLELAEFVEVEDPLIAVDFVGVEVGEQRVCADYPASRGDTIRLILKLLGFVFIEILKERILNQLRMYGSHPINRMRANNTQISHPHLLRRRLLNQRQPPQLLIIPGKPLGNRLQPHIINHIDNLQVPRQQLPQYIHPPLLERLRKHRMVCVSESMPDDIPCTVMLHELLVDEDA